MEDLTKEQIAMLLALAGVVMNKSTSAIVADLKADTAKADDFKTKAVDYGKSMLQQGVDKVLPLVRKAAKKKLGVTIGEDVVDVEEIFKAIDTAITEKATAEPDEAKVKASQVYKDLQGELTKEQEKVTNITANQAKALKKVTAANALLNLRTEVNAIVPEDATAAQLKHDAIQTALISPYDFEENGSGDFFLKKADGSYLLNANGHKATLKEEGTKYYTALYGIQTVQTRENMNPQQQNNPMQQQQQQGTFKHYKPEHGTFPKTQEELTAFQTNYNIPGLVKQEVATEFARLNPAT